MKHRLTSLALALLPAFCAMAQDFESLSFKLTNGEARTFAFREKPTITFDNDYYHVKTTTESIVIGRSEVLSYGFDGQAAAIITPTAPNLCVRRVSNDLLRVEGAPAGCIISLWTVGGQNCLTLTTGEAGAAHVDLTNLVAGTYVVRIGECQTLKIVKQ